MIRSVDGKSPEIAESAYVDERADVIGNVTLGADASVWPGAVLRGDDGPIEIREGVNVQDNAICHEGVLIEPYVTVGHTAIVHAATVGERSIVGMSSVVLDDAEIGHHSIVAAGSVVTEGTEVPPYSLVAGTPAEVIRDVPEDEDWFEAADHYVEKGKLYQDTAEVPDRGQ
jgi:carbonic anhydrase/acetyltransferase-like protein (isoleucine patch superfamily)